MRAPKKKEKKAEYLNRVLIDKHISICEVCKHNTSNYKDGTVDVEVMKFFDNLCQHCIYKLRKGIKKMSSEFYEREKKVLNKTPWLENNFKWLYEWEGQKEKENNDE